MVVQHNLTAMNSNRMLGITTNTQAKSTEKLSSGYKINRAADDAAGLSISEKMRKQIRGLTQASLNAQDGISAVQTAEGALNEVQDMLQRMNELAVKAANGTMSETDRTYIQNEIDQLVTEIDRVSETTKFNETYLLKGDRNEEATNYQYTDNGDPSLMDGKTLFAKDKDGVVTEITTDEALKTALETEGTTILAQKEETASTGTKAAATDLSPTAVTLTSKLPNQTSATNITTNTWSAGAADNTQELDIAGMNAGKIEIAGVEINFGTGIDATAVEAKKDAIIAASEGTITDVKYDSGKIIVTGKDVAADQALKDIYDEKGDIVINKGEVATADQKANITDYYTEAPGDAKEEVEAVAGKDYKEAPKSALYDVDGNKISANGLATYFDDQDNYKGGLYSDDKGTTAVTSDNINDYVDSSGKKTGALTLKLHVGADATKNNQITLDIDAMSASCLGVKGLRVDGKDDTNALDAIETVKAAIQQVSTQRSALGAIQNRLEHTINNLDNVVENTTAAESQIRDTDMATEMVKYSNNNILSQAGTAMLAQSNQANQSVLSLLG